MLETWRTWFLWFLSARLEQLQYTGQQVTHVPFHWTFPDIHILNKWASIAHQANIMRKLMLNLHECPSIFSNVMIHILEMTSVSLTQFHFVTTIHPLFAFLHMRHPSSREAFTSNVPLSIDTHTHTMNDVLSERLSTAELKITLSFYRVTIQSVSAVSDKEKSHFSFFSFFYPLSTTSFKHLFSFRKHLSTEVYFK